MSAEDPSWRETARRRLIALGQTSVGERVLIAASALLLSILLGTVIVFVAGLLATCRDPVLTIGGSTLCYDPFYVFDRLFLGALGNPLSGGWSPLNPQFALTLRETTVLVFTGLSVALAFRAGIFNIGTQGQLVIGGLLSSLTVLWAAPLVSGGLGAVLLVPLGILAGAVGGGAYGAIPGALKAYAEANEVITTIMLNFVAVLVARYLATGPFNDPNSQANQTPPLPAAGQFPSVVFDPRTDFSILALLLALAFVVGLYYLLTATAFGYDLRTAGIQPAAAEYGGVDAARTVVSSLTLSGAIGGVGGAVYLMMTLGTFQTGVPSYGFDGITVSILAGNNPIGVVFVALLFGVLKSGSNVVAFATNVPPQLVGVLRGLIILFVAMPEFFRLVGKRLAAGRGLVAVVAGLLLAALGIAALVAPESGPGRLFGLVVSSSTLAATLRLSAPIVFAAIGGIFAEKSGVINIGLEGLLIIAAFTAVFGADVTGSLWLGFLVAVVAATALSGLFAVVCIEFRADQIIAGLAVWLIALGLAPFGSQVIYGGPNTDSVGTLGTITVPVLAELPVVGALFDASPAVYLMFLAVGVAWYTLNRTAFGRWVRAAGENPKALDTAGVDVSRVRYAAVLLSGAFSGMGGASLAFSIGQFTGNGPTMVNGKGFIAIVAYLFGNYNPIGALLSTALFAGLDAIQLRLQTSQLYAVPDSLVQTIPFVAVVVVLAFVGKTRLPEAAGEHYESGEE